jgi:protein-S-isoprenylcysteine O-methyltransferase Ste14
MRLDQIAAPIVNQLMAPLLRRALVAALLGLAALIALYHLTVAGTLALELQYGALNAHLIIAAIYVVLALIAFFVLWAMWTKPAVTTTPALSEPRNMQLLMLVEAVMLGYSLSRKSDRTR